MEKSTRIIDVAVLQFDVIAGDIKANIDTVTRLMEDIQADLVVLPELCFSGYALPDLAAWQNVSDAAARKAILSSLTKLAIAHNCLIVAGLSEWVDNKLYNTAVLVGAEGLIGQHRKMNRTDNEQHFTAGETLAVHKADNLCLGLPICFDSWFPESCRILAMQGAEIFCIPANFGGAWTLDVAKVRALENGIPVVLANRIGTEIIAGELATFRGHSLIIDSEGNVLAAAGGEETVLHARVALNPADRDRAIICQNMAKEKARYHRYIQYHPNPKDD